MTEKKRLFAEQLAERIDSGEIRSFRDLNKAKLELSKKLGISRMPPNPSLLQFLPVPSIRVQQLFGTKPVRTISGVAPLAIMTKPINCRHGSCIFCPGGTDSVFGNTSKSYTGHEPASMRAQANFFDAYLQTMNRLYQFAVTNHNFQKIELIIMGGTFPSFPKNYRHSFVAETCKALNDFSERFFSGSSLDFEKFNAFFHPSRFEYMKKAGFVQRALLKQKGKPNLKKEQKRNETAAVRLVTFCVETKPDYCKKTHINDLLEVGVTRVELGVQALQDEILSFCNRGHSVSDSVLATRLLKDSALKVTFHMMPGLPKSNPELDLEMFRELFQNPDFCPDALKIYPCMVMPGTALQKLFEQKKFVPLSTEEAALLIARAKRFVPKWCRIQRVMRDIPSTLSSGGPKSNNLRQLVQQKARQLGIECQCIRCREAGHLQHKKGIQLDASRAVFSVEEYEASKGTEFFVSAEEKKEDALFGFCRLRFPFEPFRKEISSNSALVRELHVFGEAAALGAHSKAGIQHHGLGKQLLQKAESIAMEEFGSKKMIVISGIGAREYYRKLGYRQEGAYMEKMIG
jgi:elongator complex protein 3